MTGARGWPGRTAIAVTVLAVGLRVAVSESVGDDFYD